MNKLKFERLYTERGLKDYKLKSREDLFFIHGIKLNQVYGFNNLKEDQKKLTERSIINYLNSKCINKRNIVIIKFYFESEVDEEIKMEYIEDGEICFRYIK
ncbi:hypothetical protein SAMN04487886_11576 [Clostridium sp. DSM 8431]|uniref:hypothetical protein n=1 Tax=Clostridium sp. DSM 8431 TaxID=1761781 RepID=UPI0008EB791A|nr:hypothetical protein [Clostridium sp. DSM 8431]SFU78246.1 hypothetical protein SAMN04487886_11576 [Clostridium sp. DSM 8431]